MIKTPGRVSVFLIRKRQNFNNSEDAKTKVRALNNCEGARECCRPSAEDRAHPVLSARLVTKNVAGPTLEITTNYYSLLF